VQESSVNADALARDMLHEVHRDIIDNSSRREMKSYQDVMCLKMKKRAGIFRDFDKG